MPLGARLFSARCTDRWSTTTLSSGELVPISSLPSGAKVLSYRWVFSVKPGAVGSNAPPRYKARLVVRGDGQREGIDYGEVFSPVVSSPTLRILLAVAAERDYELDQLDAVTAFLNASVDEELYMRVPDGYTAPPSHVLRLRKSLYGLKQAPRCWNLMLQERLVAQGLQQCSRDLTRACMCCLASCGLLSGSTTLW